MFIQGHSTTKVDSIGVLWLKVKEIKTYIKTKKKPTTKLTNLQFSIISTKLRVKINNLKPNK